MTPDVLDIFTVLDRERRLDTPVFLYNGKPWKNPRTAFTAVGRGSPGLRPDDLRHTASTNLRRAGVDTMAAMKIVGHKTEQMNRRFNTIQLETSTRRPRSYRSIRLTL